MADASPEDRVRRGAALLDRKAPGWRRQVDPARIDSASAAACVLALACGGFGKGLAVLFGRQHRDFGGDGAGLSWGELESHGLVASSLREYALLDFWWAAAVRDGPRARGPPPPGSGPLGLPVVPRPIPGVGPSGGMPGSTPGRPHAPRAVGCCLETLTPTRRLPCTVPRPRPRPAVTRPARGPSRKSTGLAERSSSSGDTGRSAPSPRPPGGSGWPSPSAPTTPMPA